MSTTPRTDAEFKWRVQRPGNEPNEIIALEAVDSDFARQLELELNATKQALEIFQESVAHSIISNLKSDAAFNKSGL